MNFDLSAFRVRWLVFAQFETRSMSCWKSAMSDWEQIALDSRMSSANISKVVPCERGMESRSLTL